MSAALLVARLLLTAVFAAAGLAKLADRAGTRRAAVGFGVPSRLAGAVTVALPIAELAVAMLLVPAATAVAGAACALVLLLAFGVAIARSIARGQSVDCHCFGQLQSAPVGWWALGRNAGLAALALLIVTAGEGGPTATAWLAQLERAEQAAVALCAALAAGLARAAWPTLRRSRLRARLLLSLNPLEHALPAPNILDEPAAPLEPPEAGLRVGAPAPAFSLSDLEGRMVALEELLASGRPLLLVFADPGCGPCRALLPQIARWQGGLEDGLRISVVSRGAPRENREEVAFAGVRDVLLQRDREVSRAYAAYGTPSAVAVTPNATLASPVASGAEEIRSLVERTAPGRLGSSTGASAGPAPSGGSRVAPLARRAAACAAGHVPDAWLEFLARALARPMPRRRLLALAGASVAASVLGAGRAPEARAQTNEACERCLPGQVCCWNGPGDWSGVSCCSRDDTPGPCCSEPSDPYHTWCCGCHRELQTPCGEDPRLTGVPSTCCSKGDQKCCGSGRDATCCPASWRCGTDSNGKPTCECPDTITVLADCPNRVQRSAPTVNGCGGAGTPQAVTDFLNRFKEADFRPACDAHDICYGTCRKTQKECDDRILDDLRAICRATYSVDEFERRGVCLSQARAYYRAVSASGQKFYEQAQRKFCQCCPDNRERPSPPALPRPRAPDKLTRRGNSVRVRVNCPGPTVCRGDLRLSIVRGPQTSGATAAATRRRRKILLGKRGFRVPARQTAEVKVRLSGKGRRLLRRRERLTVLATARTQLPGGKELATGLDSFVLTAQHGHKGR